MPVGEMPMRGAPMLTPVAERLMPTGDVLMKQGLYENIEPPPEICIQADRPRASCHAMTEEKLVWSLYTTHVLCWIRDLCIPAACRGPTGF